MMSLLLYKTFRCFVRPALSLRHQSRNVHILFNVAFKQAKDFKPRSREVLYLLNRQVEVRCFHSQSLTSPFFNRKMSDATSQKTDQPTEQKPPDQPTEQKPTDQPTEQKPTDQPTEQKPTDQPTEHKPTPKTEEDPKTKNESEGDATERKADDKPSRSKDSSDDSSSTKERYATRRKFLKKHELAVQETREKFFSMPIAEKRMMYKCRKNFITIDDIPTWREHFESEIYDDEDMVKWWKINKKNVQHKINDSLNDKISFFRGDITALEIDAIANAANESLLGGAGVDGAIHSAAGSKLLSECELLGGCEPGGAKITCGYKLPAKHVIHTVGPRGERPDVLKSCYATTLELLKENQLKSVAFPCISTGVFGYPNQNAAIVALKTVRDWLETEKYAKNIERIIFCIFLQKDADIYDEQAQLFFPLDRDNKTVSTSDD